MGRLQQTHLRKQLQGTHRKSEKTRYPNSCETPPLQTAEAIEQKTTKIQCKRRFKTDD